MAVAHADHILQLQENLDRDEMPPEWMWPFTDEMNEHIDRVQADRRNRYSSGGSDSPSSEDTMQDNQLLVRPSGRR